MNNSESEVQRLEGIIYELETELKEHRDKGRIYHEIVSDINQSIIDLFKREQENIRFNLGEEIDYRECISNMKDYLDNLKREYKGRLRF